MHALIRNALAQRKAGTADSLYYAPEFDTLCERTYHRTTPNVVYLVHLVCLVYLVGLIHLVYFVPRIGTNQTNKTNQMNQTNHPS